MRISGVDRFGAESRESGPGEPLLELSARFVAEFLAERETQESIGNPFLGSVPREFQPILGVELLDEKHPSWGKPRVDACEQSIPLRPRNAVEHVEHRDEIELPSHRIVECGDEADSGMHGWGERLPKIRLDRDEGGRARLDRESREGAVARSDVEHSSSRGDVPQRSEEGAGEESSEDVRACRWGARREGTVKHGECSEIADAHRAAAIIECRAMTGAGSLETPADSRFSWIAIATVAVAILRLATRQATHWELDEHLFRMGVESFEPMLHRPHPPGYPLLIGLAKLIGFVVNDPFIALMVLAWISSIVGFFAFAMALRAITGSEPVALIGALLFHLSPAMLVHGAEPMSDPPALMFLALAFWAATRLETTSRGWAMVAFAASCAASIGCRPQYAVPIIPVFLAVVALRGSVREKLAGLVTFTGVCLLWIVPLIVAVGGLDELVQWETGQAAYVAAHDAHLSRGTRSWIEIVLRFVAHPWGPKALAIPTLALAVVGFVALVRRRAGAAWPLVAVSAIHLGFTIATSDPSDGVRYQLPAQMAVALAAAVGLELLARRAGSLRAAFVAASVLVASYGAYAWPVVYPRATQPSPPVRAIAWANERLDRSSIVLWDASLRAHADAALRGFETMPVEEGLARYYDRPDVELWVLADGTTRVPGAQVFSWPASDAYGKLTRDHYRTVSLISLVPERRYLPLEGVNPWERDAARPEWRWLDQVSKLRVPPGAGDLRLEFELPKEVPFPSTTLRFRVDGARGRELVIRRGESASCVLPLEDGRYAELKMVSSEAFTPAMGEGRDPRRLALTLTGLERVPRSGGAPR